jgi:glycosyltransferase involved in cell wall biosynthesis
MEQKGDFEFIVVNDFSTDGSEDIALAYQKADKRFKPLLNQHKKGVSGARNTGLDHMSGEWFTFLDADDTLCDNAHEVLNKATEKNVNIFQFNHLRHYEKHDRTVMKYEAYEGWYDVGHLPMCWCMVWNKLYRAETFGKVRFVEGLQYGEDEIFNLECFDIDDHIYNVADTFMVHRFTNKKSLSKTKSKDMDGLLAQARALEELLYRLKRPQTRSATCDVLAEHWTSPTYRKAFVDKDIE